MFLCDLSNIKLRLADWLESELTTTLYAQRLQTIIEVLSSAFQGLQPCVSVFNQKAFMLDGLLFSEKAPAV